MTDADASRLLDDMTLAEQAAILSGTDFWSVVPPERLGLGTLRVTDGPNGARGGGSLIGGVTAAAFPVGIAIGASWSTELAGQIGAALADEVKSKGAHVSLAPTVNIQRSVTNGRNFECYSEDPELTAALAVAYIRGLQGQGIAATVKHFAGNESEIERTTIDSVVGEQALREIYLRPFEDAVRKAGTWAVMSSYNKLNGTYAAENHWLLTQVLRGDWGFDGVVMSDWFGSRSTAPTVNAGLDLEMPGPTRDRGDKLVAAVAAGEVSAATVRERAANMIRLMARVGSLSDHGPHAEQAIDRPETRALIRRAGAEGAVLLKNDGGLLPLAAPQGKIAVIGPNARIAQIMGGGSAQLNPHYAVTPWQGLVDALGEDALAYAPGCTNHRWEPLLTGPITADYFASTDLSGPVAHSDRLDSLMTFWIPPIAGGQVDPAAFSARFRTQFTPDRSGLHRVGIATTGPSRVLVDGVTIADARVWTKGRTFFEEGCDEVVGEVMLTAGRAHEITVEFAARRGDNLQLSALRVGIGRPLGDDDIAEAAALAASCETAVVFVGRSGEWDTEGSDLDGISLPGRQDDLVAAVLKANPRSVVVLQTGGPVELPWMAQAPAIVQAWYPGQEAGHAIADVLTGAAEPGGRLPQTFPQRWSDNPTQSQDPEVYPGLDGRVRYEEGLFIGYRHYDRQGIAPMFAFGHGLGYTSFAMSDLGVSAAGQGARVSVTLTNTGDRRGSTVAQVYVSDHAAPGPRPDKVLRGFAKVTLDPGQSQRVTLTLGPRDFAWFDVQGRAWRVSAGEHGIAAGFSAADLRLAGQISLPDWAEGVSSAAP